MKAIVLHCKPGSRFHFGKYAPDDDTALNDSDDLMHSDTLFAALVNIYQEIFGDAQELVNAFEEGKVKISSLLYCLKQNDKYTWLLPKPVSFNLFDAADYKQFRGIRFISSGVWENIENPSSLADTDKFQLLAGNQVAVLPDEISYSPEKYDAAEWKRILPGFRLNNIITLPKVRVRDIPKDQGIYQLTVTEIADNSLEFPGIGVHYYFLLDETGLDANIASRLNSTINMLPFNGIGAEKSTIGKIEITEIIDDWKVRMPKEGFMATLSLFSPAPDDVGKLEYYKTFLRGGRRLGRKDDNNNRFLKTVRMIAEGAILHTDTTGSLADVSPGNDKTYLRNGKPLGLPARSQWIPKL